jgi:hypothetical protein
MNDERREARKIGTQMTQILRIYADFDSEQSSPTGCAHCRVRHCDGEARAGSNLPIRIPFSRPEVASSLIARSSHCAQCNDDRAGACVEGLFAGLTRLLRVIRYLRYLRFIRFIRLSIMRRLEKNPKDFLKFVKIRLKLKMKRKIRVIRVIGYAELTFRG